MKSLWGFSMLVLAALALSACGEPALPENEDHGAFPEEIALATPDPAAALPRPLCPEPDPPLVAGLAVLPSPAMPEPQARAPFRDPVFGTCVVRVTDRTTDLQPEDRSPGLKNVYARVQSFNADGSRILVYAIDGSWYLYDSASLRPLGLLPLYTEPRWDAVDPDVIYHLDETRLLSFDLGTGASRVVHDFADDLAGYAAQAVWTRHEGRPSADGCTWGLMAEDASWVPTAFLVYDMASDVATVRDVRGLHGIEDDVDHVTISPLGAYFLASFDRYCDPGQLGDDGHPCGLMVYDRTLQRGRGLLRVIGHYDVALDAHGREVVIFQDIDADQIALLDLETGQITPLFDIDFSHTPLGFHFSGLAYGRPGWALVSTYSGGYPDAYTWMDDQVFAVELQAGGQVVRLAHTRSKVDQEEDHDYWAEPHASVNHDFTRIVFTSNWGRSGTEAVDMYLITLPDAWDATPTD
ncbi:MAG: hypothetical protein JXB35_17035 [Anaerolineae bacterium]|nr:hypothetical protein [Anaerolineae bacterium]